MKKLLTATLLILSVFLLIKTQTNAQISTGLVGYWTFDEGSGNTAGDSAGSNTGTLVNNPSWLTGANAKIGSGALSFDGVDDFMSFGLNNATNLSQKSVFMWLYSKKDTGHDILDGGYWTSPFGDLFEAGNSPNLLDIYVKNSSGVTVHCNMNGAATVGQWNHVGYTYDGSFVRCYRNGVQVGTDLALSGTLAGTAYNWTLGSRNISPTFTSSPANIDDFRIYSRALSASEITDLYNYTGGSIVSPPNPPATTTPATCTSFTYSAWSSCTNSSQTRTVTSSLPLSCTGGTPITTQSCTVTPPVIPPTGSRIFYIDYSTGSDANSGNTKSSPWKHAPGMDVFSGTYTHSSGDSFVFKGGVVWPRTVFPIHIRYSGTSANPDYYGVDQNWYVGSSWSQPTFDAQNSSITFFDLASYRVSYITIDNIHFTGFYWSGDPGYSGAVMIMMYGNDHVTIQNSLFNNWTHDSYANGARDNMKVILLPYNTNYLIKNNTFYQNIDPTKGDSGWVLYGSVGHKGVIEGNTCFNVQNCFVPSGDTRVSNNLIYNVSIVPEFDPAQHPNVIEVLGGDTIINNNVIHDIGFGTMVIDWASAGTNYIYNNLIWNTNVRYTASYPSLNADCSMADCTTGTSYIFNNTFYADNGVCLRVELRHTVDVYEKIFYQNNHCIGGSLHTIDTGASVANFVLDHNISMSTPSSISAGYTVTNKFAPVSSTSSTIDSGVNLATYCSVVPDLCKDINGVSRPQGSSWDIGAYEYVGGVITPPTPIIGDFNNDRLVNSLDFSLLVSAWNQNNATYDINHDGIVNSLDYVVMVQNWTQ